LKLFRSLSVGLLPVLTMEMVARLTAPLSGRSFVEERQRAKYSKEEKRLQAENATLVAATEAAAEKKARDAKTARLKELRLAKEREESNGRSSRKKTDGKP
jgi:hypothetical protein